MKPIADSRGTVGVVASLQEDGETIRLVFDDVDQVPDDMPIRWKTRTLFTAKEFNRNVVLDHAASEEDLADIGLNLLVRLVALNAAQKP